MSVFTPLVRRTVAAATGRRVGERRPIVERSHTVGLPPGQVPASAAGAAPSRVTAFQYGPGLVEEAADLTATEARDFADRPGVAWIHIDGVEDTATIAAFGAAFGLHPLVVEDIVHTHQRPKMEVYDDLVFVVARMVRATDETPEAAYCTLSPNVDGHVIEQVAFVLGPDFVLSFHQGDRDVFDAVRDRLRAGLGRIRRAGADYLLYALLDLVVDHTFVTLERIGDATDTLESLALDRPEPAVQAAISTLRREVAMLRRAVWPLRDVLLGLGRDDTPLVQDETRPYLRDAHDHLVQAVEILESLREILSSVADLYLSSVGTRQNEVMKVLTLFSAFFLPLTFVAGVYGMNFDPDASPLNMPELRWFYGYPFAWGVMAAITVGMFIYFRRRGWL